MTKTKPFKILILFGNYNCWRCWSASSHTFSSFQLHQFSGGRV